mgnify:CR=1 FL=1
MKKLILIVLCQILLLLLSGCTHNNKLYEINSQKVISSTEKAYDYSYCLNDQWFIDYLDDELTVYINKENDVSVSFIKIDYDNQKYGTNLESQEIPKLFVNKKIKSFDFNELQEDISRTDYHDQFKFRYSHGKIGTKKYQLVYFLSDYIIPSVSGEKVANCIVITYTEEKDKIIDQFLISIENTIHYE